MNSSRLKTSTLFPDSWNDTKIISAIENIGNSNPLIKRAHDWATWHRAIVDGVEIDVIKVGDKVTSGFPTGRINANPPGGFKK